MTVEYLVLGIVLILMGGVQIWLRRGLAAASRDSEQPGGSQQAAGEDVSPPLGAGRLRSGRIWEAWTRILGFVGIIIGIALVVIGVMGR